MPEHVRAFFQEKGREGGKKKNPRKGFGSMDKKRHQELLQRSALARLGHAVSFCEKRVEKKLLTPRP